MSRSPLERAIAENARTNQSVATKDVSVHAHPLPDQIEADRYLAAARAAKHPSRGLAFTKLVPPGAV